MLPTPNKYTTKSGALIQYYKLGSSGPKLVMLHTAGSSSATFDDVADIFSRRMQVYLIDCPGHGGSQKDKSLYTLSACGDAIHELIMNEIGGPIALVGHLTGGLIAAYIASKSVLCGRLILEDAPIFAASGEARMSTYNFADLPTVSHNFISSDDSNDFQLYYFENQNTWTLFPDKTREKTKGKFLATAKKYRAKHPDKDLKVLFWPSEAFIGMKDYDPYFGEALYNDSFNDGIDYEELLKNIKCRTLFMKSDNGDDGLTAPLSDSDLEHILECVPRIESEEFKCGQNIHIDRTGDFNRALKNFIFK